LPLFTHQCPETHTTFLLGFFGFTATLRVGGAFFTYTAAFKVFAEPSASTQKLAIKKINLLLFILLPFHFI